MKKTFHFTELSDKVCNVDGCNRKLKERTVDAKLPGNIAKCYRCYEALAASEMRRDDIPAHKTTLKHIKALRFQFKLDKPADEHTKTKTA